MMDFGITGMGMGFGWIVALLVACAIMWLFYHRAQPKHSILNESESAEEILHRRFARGEISKEKYEEILNLLENKTRENI